MQSPVHLTRALFRRYGDCLDLGSVSKKEIFDCGFRLILTKSARERDFHFDGKFAQFHRIPISVVKRVQGHPRRQSALVQMATRLGRAGHDQLY